MKNIISSIAAIALIFSSLSCIADIKAEASETVFDTVSGYVSAENGDIEIASKNKTPKIYVDENDYAGVVCAAGDLLEDIEKVTGVKPEYAPPIASSEDKNITLLSTDDYESGIFYDGGKMTMLPPAYEDDGMGIVAAYDENGALTGFALSQTKSSDGSFEFDKTVTALPGGYVKGFVWNSLKGMKNLTGVITDVKTIEPTTAPTAKPTDVPTAKPTNTPTTEPTNTPTAKPTNEPSTEPTQAPVTPDADIIIGTVGKSDAIDALIAANKIDVSEIQGEWEAFTIQNVDGTLVIAGADKRGTMYGVYDLSEKMGVSPWEWWADVTPQHSDAIYVTLPQRGYTQGAPAVKYRGIFINQEYNLWNWSKSLAGEGETGMNAAAYEKIFGLMARLGANYMWPAMHEYSPAFNNNPLNAQNADKYGIAMGGSHCEMLLRNNVGELLDFQTKWIEEHPDAKLYMFKDSSVGNKEVAYDYTDIDKEGNRVDNKQFIEDYWRERIKTNGKYENVYTVGMRGVHDGQWNPVVPSQYTTTKEKNQYKIDLLEEIIDKQREILSEEIGKKANEIPQVFIPYKEILDLYNANVDNPLSIPEDITIMWTNDNYGHIRQGATEAERQRSGGGGMYYHVSYHGKPTDVIWTAGTQLGLIKEEMVKAYDEGANNIWILNVGPLKPFENQMEYFIDLGRNMESLRSTSVNDYVKDNAKRYYGFDDIKAQKYADIQCEYLQLANSRRPEFMQQGKFSLTAYGDEMQKEADKYASLLERSTVLYNSLTDDLKPAFYELQLYAIKTANDVWDNYIGADKSVLYASQSRGASVNKYIKQSTEGRAAIDTDTALYNTMLNGKWNNVINPWQNKEIGSWVIKIASAKAADAVTELPYTRLGVAAENQTDLSAEATLEFSGYTKDVRFIDIFNQGTGSLNWRVTANKDWVTFNKTSGTVYDDDRIYAGIDWTKAPTGSSNATITVTQYIGETAVDSKNINVTVSNSVKADLPEKTYAEANGYVSIEAEHYTSSVASGDYKWQEQDDLGRSGTSMKFVPDTAAGVSDNSAYLEYNVNFDTAGTFDIDVYRMPTLDERGSVRFAVGIDGGTPTVLAGTNKYSGNSNDKWGEGVLNNNETLTAKIAVNEAGVHKIRLYGMDTGVIIDKMVITTGTKYASYYGAPESYNTTYNTSPAVMPEAKTAATEVTGNITALFEPTLYISGLSTDSGKITGAHIIKLGAAANAQITVAAYDNSGAMLDSKTVTGDFSSAQNNEKVTVPIEFEIPNGTAEIQAIAYDSAETLNALSPAYTANEAVISLMAAYDSGKITARSSLDEYKGKEAICRITDDNTGDEVYIRQETVSDETFKTINTGSLNGTYSVYIGVADEGIVAEEKAYTQVNITTDTEENTVSLYNWDFETDQTNTEGNSVPAVSGGAVYDSSNKAVNTGTGGSVAVNLEDAVKAVQGSSVTVVSKIAYGKESGKYMNYEIKDSNGKSIVYSHISAYNTGAQLIKIGDSAVLDQTAGLPAAIARENSALSAGFTTYTTVMDFDENTVTLTLSSSKGTENYKGKLPEGTSYDVKQILFTNSYSNSGRVCYVDDISITKTTAPSYTMTFDIKDTDGNEVPKPTVTVTDKKYNTVIAPEKDGSYHLCDGVYSYTVTADGYGIVRNEIELSPATASKTIPVRMTAGGGSTVTDAPSETAKPQETDAPSETEKPQETVKPLEGTVQKFDFGGSGAAEGYTAVSADRSYTDNLDYGFIGIKYDDYKLAAGEYMDGFRTVKGQQIELENGTRAGEDADSDFVAVKNEQNPLRFTMEAENGGYYHVKVKLVNASDSEKASVSLFGERSHLLLTDKEIEPGGELTYEFNADVETYYRKALNGKYTDDTLSIELTGRNAAIASMEVTKLDTNSTTLWVLGDSTGCDQSRNYPYYILNPFSGVGEALAKYLPENIALSNQGDGGIASNDTTHWGCVKSAMKEGDYLYIEYGHNESGVDGYKSNLENYYKECHDRGVKMIVVGPIDRCQTKQFNSADGTWTTTLKGYSDKGKEFVEEKIALGNNDIAFVDLNASWIEFLNSTTAQVKEIRGTENYESDSVYYYYKYKTGGIDTTHINDAGADNAAYIFFTQAKAVVEAGKDAAVGSYEKVNADVLSGIVDGMRDETPFTITEEIVNAGKVGSNSLYPVIPTEEYNGYEAEITNTVFDDSGLLTSVTANVEHYDGLEAKDILYAVAVAELYNDDGTKKGTYQSTAATKYDTTNGNGTFTLAFSDANAVLPEGGTYKIWLQSFTSDNELIEGEDYRISDYFTPASLSEVYLIGDKEDIKTPDTFLYYGVKDGTDISGNNDWYLVGSSTRSAKLQSEMVEDAKIGYAELKKDSTSGSWYLYRAFDNKYTSGKITLETDLYYESGYMKFLLSNKTSEPTNSNASKGINQRIDSFYINNNGKLYDGNNTELAAFPKNEWIHISYEADLDYGTQTLKVGSDTYTYSINGLDTIIPAEVTITGLQQFNISGSSSYKMSARMTNTSAKRIVNDSFDTRTLTLAAPDSAQGTVAITGNEELAKTAQINSLITVSAEAKSGYKFSGWYEDDTLISETAETQIRLHKDVTLTAKFIPLEKITLTANADDAEHGTIYIDGISADSTDVDQGTDVELVAASKEGYKFINWTDEGGNVLSQSATYKITVNEAMTVTASFEALTNGDKVWDFTKYVGTNTVSDEKIETYGDLTIYMQSGDIMTNNGLVWTKAGATDKNKPAPSRYITYTPTESGTLSVTFHSSYTASKANNNPRVYIIGGDDTSCMEKTNCDSNGKQATTSGANKDTTVSIDAIAGKTYYIWGYCYNKSDAPFNITNITFTADTE